MSPARTIPVFATEPWYSDPSDHRCPHDSWLETVEVIEPAEGQRKEIRKKAIRLRLFGAYHDGHIVFQYSDVKRYSLNSSSTDRGHGDWLEDRFSISESGDLVHHIKWERGDWFIESSSVTYEWLKNGG